MGGESFRFIHAGDFHLEAPPGDLDQVPGHLRDPLASAAHQAAAAVFEAAAADNVDFLVLSGDLLNPATAGPRGISLMLNHFEQLHQKDTPVFWAAGAVDDPVRWPEAVPLPPNVTLFPKNRTLSVPVQRAGRTICHVIGRSSEGRSQLHVPSFRVDPTDEFTVALGFGATDAEALAEGRFDYWALGSEHNRSEMKLGESAAAYCGTPQGRSMQETGPHGYTEVDVDSERNVRIHAVECDLFRYCRLELDASEIATTGNVRGVLSARIARLLHDNGSRHLILGCEIAVSADTMHLVGDPEELLQWLRREHGHGSPAAWTASLRVRPPKAYPKNWCEEDTILGDFLRAAAKHAKNGGRELDLGPFTEEHAVARSVAALLGDAADAARGELLDDAALIGVEYLRGGSPRPIAASAEPVNRG